jgi:hypothetical protein
MALLKLALVRICCFAMRLAADESASFDFAVDASRARQALLWRAVVGVMVGGF